MTLEIDVPTVTAIHKAAGEVRTDVTSAASLLSGAPGTGVEGFLINDAIERTQKRFTEKTDWCARRWENFSWAIDATVKDMRVRDKANAAGIVKTVYKFQYPPGGPGVRD